MSVAGLNSVDKVGALLDQFGACQAVRPLLNEVNAKGPFTVSFTSDWKEAPHGAAMWPLSRKIVLLESSSQSLSNLLFETINMKKADTMASVNRNLCYLAREVYAQVVERLEYETVAEHHKIASQCVKEGAWDRFVDLYAYKFGQTASGINSWNTIEGYLKTQEIFGHTDKYRQRWDQLCR